MPTIPQIRGAILEELVLALLERAGYRILNENDGDEIRNGHSGLEIQGRGEWHQVDALASYDFTPAFMYPLRLIVEAKAYLPKGDKKGKVGIDVIRNAVGVLKDVNENYFSHRLYLGHEYKFRRFNYTYAVFSLYGFTKNAQRYAMAHQIFLIQYHHTPLFDGIRRLLTQIDRRTGQEYFYSLTEFDLRDFRERVREFLKKNDDSILKGYMTDNGIHLMHELRKELEKIGGSYFGLLNGEYPIHVLSKKPIQGIGYRDIVRAEVYVTISGHVEVTFDNNKLFFELPEDVARIFSEVWGKKRKIAKLKREYISFITLSGKIDGIRRSIRIELDKDWLEEYLRRTF